MRQLSMSPPRTRADSGRPRSLRALQGQDPSRCPPSGTGKARPLRGRTSITPTPFGEGQDDDGDRTGARVRSGSAPSAIVALRQSSMGPTFGIKGGGAGGGRSDARTDGGYESAFHRRRACGDRGAQCLRGAARQSSASGKCARYRNDHLAAGDRYERPRAAGDRDRVGAEEWSGAAIADFRSPRRARSCRFWR